MADFNLVSDFKPAGDQAQAIDALVKGIENKDKQPETSRIHREVNVFSLKVKKVSLQWFRSVH